MAYNITSKSGRAALQARREPYWARIKAGLFVGYRKTSQGEGTWIARRRSDDGKQQYHALGSFVDFDVATKSAEAWASSIEAGVTQHGTTVSEACKAYIDQLKAHKGSASANDTEIRFKRLVYTAPIGRIQLAKLKTSDLKSWLNAQVKTGDEEEIRKSKDSANRNLNSLKAALNLALKDRLVSTDAGWKTVTTFKDVGRRRQGYIPLDQRKALLAACPHDLRQLVTALLLTGARPGELANANVNHFDKVQGTIALSSNKTGLRIVALSTTAIQFFLEQTKDRIGNAPIFVRADGQRWGKDAWKKPFKKAAKSAGLETDAVMYSLRHTAISELILGGMDSLLVAKLAGTSTAMIEEHYGHVRHDAMRKNLDAVSML